MPTVEILPFGVNFSTLAIYTLFASSAVSLPVYLLYVCMCMRVSADIQVAVRDDIARQFSL